MAFDTSSEALQVQAEVQRRLGGYQRFLTACMMSQTIREMAIERIRLANPEFDDQKVRDQLLFELYGFRTGT